MPGKPLRTIYVASAPPSPENLTESENRFRFLPLAVFLALFLLFAGTHEVRARTPDSRGLTAAPGVESLVSNRAYTQGTPLSAQYSGQCRREIDLRVLPSVPGDRVTHITEGDGATRLNMFAEFVCGTMHTGDLDITVDLAGSADSNAVGYDGPSSVDVTISGSSGQGWTPFTITPVDNTTPETTNTITMRSTSRVSNLNNDTNWIPINSTSLEIRNDDPVPLPSDPNCRREIDLKVLPSGPGNPVTHITEGDGPTELNMFAEFFCGTMHTGDMEITVDLAGSADSNAVDYDGPSSVDVTIKDEDGWGWTPFTLTPVVNSASETTNTITISSSTQVSNIDRDINWIPINSTSLEIRNDDSVHLPNDPNCRREIDLSVRPSDITSGNRVTHITEGDGATQLNMFAAFACGIIHAGDMEITVDLAGSTDSNAVGYNGPSSVNVTIDQEDGNGWTLFTITPVDNTTPESTNTITMSSTSQVSNLVNDTNWITINPTSLEVRDDDSGGNTQSVEIQSSPPVSPASSPPPPPPAEKESGSGDGEGQGEEAENVPAPSVPSGEAETGAGGCALVSRADGSPSGAAFGLFLAASLLLAVSFGKRPGREKAH